MNNLYVYNTLAEFNSDVYNNWETKFNKHTVSEIKTNPTQVKYDQSNPFDGYTLYWSGTSTTTETKYSLQVNLSELSNGQEALLLVNGTIYKCKISYVQDDRGDQSTYTWSIKGIGAYSSSYYYTETKTIGKGSGTRYTSKWYYTGNIKLYVKPIPDA